MRWCWSWLSCCWNREGSSRSSEEHEEAEVVLMLNDKPLNHEQPIIRDRSNFNDRPKHRDRSVTKDRDRSVNKDRDRSVVKDKDRSGITKSDQLVITDRDCSVCKDRDRLVVKDKQQVDDNNHEDDKEVSLGNKTPDQTQNTVNQGKFRACLDIEFLELFLHMTKY